MALIVDRTNGQNYAENLVNYALSFNSGTWTVSSGTGTSLLNTGTFFEGESSLLIQNNVPASDITVTNASQTTTIVEDGEYQISLYLRKNIALEVRQLDVTVYQNASPLTTQECILGSTDAEFDLNDEWVRFQMGVNYLFTKGDAITFQFTLKGATTGESTTFIYVDALMLNLAERGNNIVPAYVKPQAEIVSASYVVNEATTEPSPANSTSVTWLASGSGTKDGVAYDEGDVLITSVDSSGTSKTLLILDFSTL